MKKDELIILAQGDQCLLWPGITKPMPLTTEEAYKLFAKKVGVLYIPSEGRWIMEGGGNYSEAEGSRAGLHGKVRPMDGSEIPSLILMEMMPSMVGRSLMDSGAVEIEHIEGRHYRARAFGMLAEGEWVHFRINENREIVKL